MEITKKQRLDAYRAGITASAMTSRDEMRKAGDKAFALSAALSMIANADKADAGSLTDLVIPLQRHIADFCHARKAYFGALEASDKTDAELARDHDERYPGRAIGRVRKAVR